MSPVAKSSARAPTERQTRAIRSRASAFTAAMGITRVANITGLDCIGIPVVMVCRPNSRSLAVAQGKGLDLEAARASGLMESIEFYHAERIQLPLLLAASRRAASQPPAGGCGAPAAATHQSVSSNATRVVDRGPRSARRRACLAALRDAPIEHDAAGAVGSGCFLGGSNGLASGNHLLEATSHAICEVVERDASTMFGLLDAEAQAARRIDLSTSMSGLRRNPRALRAGECGCSGVGHHQRRRHCRLRWQLSTARRTRCGRCMGAPGWAAANATDRSCAGVDRGGSGAGGADRRYT